MRQRFIGAATALVALGVPPLAIAGEGDIGPVYVESVAVVIVPTGAHTQADFEIKIKNGFAVPSTVACDSYYITTKKTTDPDKTMYSLVLSAQLTQQPVYLRITDSATYTAFSGRCSLVYANMMP